MVVKPFGVGKTQADAAVGGGAAEFLGFLFNDVSFGVDGDGVEQVVADDAHPVVGALLVLLGKEVVTPVLDAKDAFGRLKSRAPPRSHHGTNQLVAPVDVDPVR